MHAIRMHIHVYIHTPPRPPVIPNLPAYITFGSYDFSSATIPPCSYPPPPPVPLWPSIAHPVVSLIQYYQREPMFVCKPARIGACSRRRQLSCPALSIAAPRQRALSFLYPSLYLCFCVSFLCVSDLTYLSPFVSLSLCYCSWDGRPSIMQPMRAIPRPVRSFCSRERTSPPRTM